MSISVIIPFYNETIFLSQTVHSALGLGHRLHQIIIVDDSPGRYPDLLDRIASLDARIEIVTNAQNSGASASRNAGLARVTGGQVLFLDSDDVISSQAFLQASDLMQRKRAELVHVPTTVMAQKNSALFRFPRDDRLFGRAATGLSPETFPEIRYAVANWSFLFDANYLAAHSIAFDPAQRMFEDHLFILGAVENARNFALLGKWGHVWRRRGGSLTTTNYSRKDIDSQLASVRKCLGFLSERYEPDSAAVQRDVAFALSRYLMTWPTLFSALSEPETQSAQSILKDLAQAFAPYSLTHEVCSDATTLRILRRSLPLVSGAELATSQLPQIFKALVQENWDTLAHELQVTRAAQESPPPQPQSKHTVKDALDRFHAATQLETSKDLRLFSEVVFDEIDEWGQMHWGEEGASDAEIADLFARFADDLAAGLRKRSINSDLTAPSFDRLNAPTCIESFRNALALTDRYSNGERDGDRADSLTKPALAAAWRAVEDGVSPIQSTQSDETLAALANRAVNGDADIWGRRKIKARARMTLRRLLPILRL